MDCSLPGSSVHGIFQARKLEWVAISFSRGSSPPQDWTSVFYVSWKWQPISFSGNGNPYAKINKHIELLPQTIYKNQLNMYQRPRLPGDTGGKEPTCPRRRRKRHGFNPWIRKIPWWRVWQPTPLLPYSCLEYQCPMDRAVQWAPVHRITELDTTEAT